VGVNGRIVEGASVELFNCSGLKVEVEILNRNWKEVCEKVSQAKVYEGTHGIVIEVFAGDKQALVKWVTGLKCRVPLEHLKFVQ